MFNRESVDFLKVMNKITNSMVLSYPITTGRTESADIAYKFDLSKYDTDGFENPIGIYDLSTFLNIFGLCDEDREVNIDNNSITVSDSTTSVKFLTSATSVLSAYEFKQEQFDKTNEFPSVLEMSLTSEDIRKLKSASATFRELDTAVISCDDTVELSLTQIGKFKKSSNSFRIKKNEESTKKFNIGISLETLSKIPQVDYTLIVKYNESRDAYRIILKTDKIEGLSLVVSVKNVE
jgi:hypothetical protein